MTRSTRAIQAATGVSRPTIINDLKAGSDDEVVKSLPPVPETQPAPWRNTDSSWPAEGITDAEHARLVDACESYGGPECHLYVADLVEWGERRGLGYEELLVEVDDAETDAADRTAERERRRHEAELEDLEDWADDLGEDVYPEETTTTRDPCDLSVRPRYLDCPDY